MLSKQTTGGSQVEQQYLADERYTIASTPKHRIPKQGVSGKAAYQVIRDDLELDGRPNLNLASFVTTAVDEESALLASENLTKNLADSDEYPALTDIHARCVNILADLWHANPADTAIGSATTGSSEAIHLGGLAMKRAWVERRQAAGKDSSKPNIIMGANAQVALEKFARYFDVEARLVPVSQQSNHALDVTKLPDLLDENTIGVFVILGSTYTGHYEPVEKVAAILDEFQERTGIDIPIHVDGASGGFIAPFCHPHVKWDFSIPRVHSINTSGHKYGLVSSGLGWIVWRSEACLPKHLIFELAYLGGVEQSYTLNFSRPGHQVVQQYYNFLRLGRTGYTSVHSDSLANARRLASVLDNSPDFTVVSDVHRTDISGQGDGYIPALPVVAFHLSDRYKAAHPKVQQSSISTLLRAKGYIIPNYPLPPNESNIEILRVVVRASMSRDLIDRLISDIFTVTQALAENETFASNIASSEHPLRIAHSRRVLESSLGPISRVTTPSHGGSNHSAGRHHSHNHGNFKGVC
ncbi:pyridoxal phosphate-dependent transferase [Dipodascopsis uninucleata]